MSEEITNKGAKGRCIMWFFIFVILFIVLVVWIYRMNMENVPG